MSVLIVDAVTHTYGDGASRHHALRNVSLAVAAGEVVCVAGPSGSGKSTLCHLAGGLEQPGSGNVTVDGRPAHGLADWALVAVVPQQHGLVPELSVRDNVLLPRLRAGSGTDGSAESLAALNLTELADRVVADTSLGEQQRTAIARGLVLSARLLVLDEPTGHQDDDHVRLVLTAVKAAAEDGSAVLVATHDERVLDIADRVVRLDQGRLGCSRN